MDDERKIRFLIPPFFLIGSLLWGLWCDPQTNLSTLMPELSLEKFPDLLSLLAGGGLIVVTFGFLLGTITIILLRFAFCCFYGQPHEVFVSDDAMKKIKDHLGVLGEIQTVRDKLLAGASFDHETLKKDKEGIHLWLVRRWNGFNISANSTTALLISLLIGSLLGITVTSKWLLPLLVIMALLVVSATLAWRDTMGMVEFQANRRKEIKLKKK